MYGRVPGGDLNRCVTAVTDVTEGDGRDDAAEQRDGGEPAARSVVWESGSGLYGRLAVICMGCACAECHQGSVGLTHRARPVRGASPTIQITASLPHKFTASLPCKFTASLPCNSLRLLPYNPLPASHTNSPPPCAVAQELSNLYALFHEVRH